MYKNQQNVTLQDMFGMTPSRLESDLTLLNWTRVVC